MSFNCSEEKWYNDVEIYKQVRNNLDRYLTQTELTKHGLHCANWYRFNAPKVLGIKTYSDFVEWCGFDRFKRNFTKDEAIKQILYMSKELNRPLSYDDFRSDDINKITYNTINRFWGNINNAKRELGLEETGTYRGHTYTKNELINIIKKFVKDNNVVPTGKLIDEENKKYNLPDRRTFDNYFGSVRNAVEEAGFNYSTKLITKKIGNKNVSIYNDKDLLVKIIFDFIDKYEHIPTCKELWAEQGRELKHYYKKYFGSWNNCLKELGLELNSVNKYTDEELKDAFIDFVNEFDRVPSIKDFNRTGRPSFWVYQQRYGSWAEACIYYGFKPNDREIEYYMDDGEVCDSSYEYDISRWLKGNNIKYERNIPYKDFVDNYNGKMNCDYKFVLDNGKTWYVEMAGFINTYNFARLKQRPEQIYYFKLKYKKKLLKRENCNYIIISVDDMKQKSLPEIFYFLNLQEEGINNG